MKAATKKKDLKEGGKKANKKRAREHDEEGVTSSEGKPGKMDPKKKKKMMDEMNRP